MTVLVNKIKMKINHNHKMIKKWMNNNYVPLQTSLEK
jgi:hypothetical protein